MSVAECAIFFLQKGLSAFAMLMFIDYIGVQHVVSAHHSFTLVVTNAPYLSDHEVVYVEELLENVQRRMVGAEQKRVVLLKDIARRFSKPGQLGSDPFADSFLQKRHA